MEIGLDLPYYRHPPDRILFVTMHLVANRQHADVKGQDLMEGMPFGRYRLIKLLGRGGMGEVWRSYDTETDRVVAIKVLPVHLSGDEQFQRRFRREAHSAARLNSPHVIPIHQYGEIDGRLYLDMRLIEGRDLASALADGPLAPARAVHIIAQVAKALHVAHTAGLLHRDIKASNVLLDDEDFAYLIDFGIARTLDETRITQTDSAIGTFHYIAPERLTIGADEDARADVYSLACLLYECLTGGPPFPGESMPQLVAAHLNARPPRPSSSHPEVPVTFDEVIARGMAKNRNERYPTAVKLADAAREAISTADPRRAPALTILPETPRSDDVSGDDLAGRITKSISDGRAAAVQPTVQSRSKSRSPAPSGVLVMPPDVSASRNRWTRRRALILTGATLLAIAVIVTVGIVALPYQPTGGSSEKSASGVSVQAQKPDITKLDMSMVLDPQSLPDMGDKTEITGPDMAANDTGDAICTVGGCAPLHASPGDCTPMLTGAPYPLSPSVRIFARHAVHQFEVKIGLATDHPDFKSLLTTCQTVVLDRSKYAVDVGKDTYMVAQHALAGKPDWATGAIVTTGSAWQLHIMGFCRGVFVAAIARNQSTDVEAPVGFGKDAPNDKDITSLVQLFNGQVEKLQGA